MVGVLKFFIFYYFSSLNLQQSHNSLNIFFFYAFPSKKGLRPALAKITPPPREYVGIRGINVVLPPRR